MSYILTFAAGMFIGGLFGVMITALCVAASRAEEQIPKDE